MPATYPNFAEILQVPGFLYWGTTSLANEVGYGTLLGYTEDGVTFEPGQEFYPYKIQETGEEIAGILGLGGSPRLFAVLQNYNATMLARLFPGMNYASAVKMPGAYDAGKALSATSGIYDRLLFAPVDTTNHPCLLFQKAVPHFVEAAKMHFTHSNRLFYPVVFTGLRKTNDADGVMYMGAISGGTLR